MNEIILGRLSRLRELMRREKIDAYLVPTDDFNGSEYVGEFFQCRKYLTGFTGSAGTAVILQDQAGLWTDGRYFLQAEKQLEGTSIDLFKSQEPGVPTIHQFLKEKLQKGQCLGFDGRCISEKVMQELKKELDGCLIRSDVDLVGEIWEDRPVLSCEPVKELAIAYAGKSRAEKLSEVRKAMIEKKADHFLLTSLDDIAWLLNLRGNDVACNPVFLSYLLMDQEKVLLFAQTDAFDHELQSGLRADGVRLLPLEEVYHSITTLPEGACVLLSGESVNSRLCSLIPEGVRILDEENPTLLLKAVKNKVEQENMRLAHLKDGVAVTRFIYWLKQNVGKIPITEQSAAEELFRLRSAQEHFMGNSFDPIIAYGPHASIIHYSATEETNAALVPEGMLLADTGGQYLEGTTDITRTIVLGPVSEEEKTMFTAVLRGHLRLASAVFRYGCTGINLDYLAREPLWRMGLDYNHGTGHGVGFYLNVHEGPNGFRWKQVPERKDCTRFEEGMITSDEPGYYKDGVYGIRHESLLLCKEVMERDGIKFMGFEELTLVPFDLAGILPEQLGADEKAALNHYHQMVYEKTSPHLPEEEQKWLREATREI